MSKKLGTEKSLSNKFEFQFLFQATIFCSKFASFLAQSRNYISKASPHYFNSLLQWNQAINLQFFFFVANMTLASQLLNWASTTPQESPTTQTTSILFYILQLKWHIKFSKKALQSLASHNDFIARACVCIWVKKVLFPLQ